VQHQKDGDEHGQSDNRIEQTIAHKKTQTIEQIVHRLHEKTIHLAIPDISRHLPFVFTGRDQAVQYKDEQEIKNYRRIVIIPDSASSGLENRAPDEDRSNKWKEAEKRSEEKIPPIYKRVLYPDPEYFEVFLHRG